MTLRFSIKSALGLLLAMHAISVTAQPAIVTADGLTEGSTEVAGPTLLELLEFIGEFTTEDGEWVDPTLLLEAGSEVTSATQDGTREGTQDATTEFGAGSPDAEQSTPVGNCRSTLCE